MSTFLTISAAKFSWEQSRTMCEAMAPGAHLAVMLNDEENLEVRHH